MIEKKEISVLTIIHSYFPFYIFKHNAEFTRPESYVAFVAL